MYYSNYFTWNNIFFLTNKDIKFIIKETKGMIKKNLYFPQINIHAVT
jgi:hypothetical protein